MNIFHHKRTDGSCALYIDGNLQFDSRDEAIYHESLVLPALCMAKQPRRVLICGGGDGFALRETLRFPGVEEVTLIDCSEEIVQYAKTELGDLNCGAFEDSRVNLIIGDALLADLPKAVYDVIVVDFTFPTTRESALGFTVEWYEKLKDSLTSEGILSVNAVSPQNTASAFACLVSTLRASGLKTLPYRVCIPSFREHGYGAWGFILASQRALTIGEFSSLSCPVETRKADLHNLCRGAHFSLRERANFHAAPANRASKPVLQGLLLNPTSLTSSEVNWETPPDFPSLVQQVEISHPYHSRGMIEALAEQVLGSIQSIDLQKLVDELVKRLASLPVKIAEELKQLQDYLSRTVLDLDLWGKWASHLFATLILVITIANTISPDPAFAKGGEGVGHASFSRGFSENQSFGGGTPRASTPITGRGFTSTYGRDPVDIYGYHYSPRVYIYDDYGVSYGGGGGRRSTSANVAPMHQSAPHKPLFVLDDDLLAMDNGDFVIPLSDSAMLLVRDGQITLMDSKSGKTLMPLYAEPKLFQEIRTEVDGQTKDLGNEVSTRRDWLSWVGWTSSMFKSVQSDTDEFNNLQDLERRLGIAMKSLGTSKERSSVTLPENAVELFIGCHVLENNDIVLYEPGGSPIRLDGSHSTDALGKSTPLTADLKGALTSVLRKMVVELQKDIISNRKERISLDLEESSTKSDLMQYEQIQAQNSFDPTYEVDYGTDSVTIVQAIRLTNRDLQGIALDKQLLDLNTEKATSDLARFQAVLQAWG